MKTLLTLTMIATLAAVPRAQAAQVLCYSFDGTGKTTGSDNTSAGSKIGIRVGGHGNVFIPTKAGMTNSDLADALEAELVKQGYTTKRDAPNVVCVVTGPGGVPLTKGGGIGSTDTGLKGIDCGVRKIQIVNPPPPVKKARRNGVAFPGPRPNQRVQRSGTITYYVDVERTQNGRKVIIPVQVQVPINPGQTSASVEQDTRQSFAQAGFPVMRMLVPDLFAPQQPLVCFGVAWDRQLDPVHHVRIDLQIADQDLCMFPVQLFAGEADILQGAVQFGEGFAGGLAKEPRIHGGGSFLLGSPFDIFVGTMTPGLPGMMILGGADTVLPAPFLHPDAFLFVDPLPSVLIPAPTDPLGAFHLGGLIPPDPQLAGMCLFTQWMVVDLATNRVAGTGGLEIVLGK